ncbi:MAG TPA: UDP-N-acetylmuramoyl-L-alanyl-D-glutamate--2,6-diaminopimelate ligase [Firmicutes bacterium]|nr:UDP-N-acetylmuramoyl-L-alanyl-D-glutamate--2,6-diaminopimelate ligase [Bacillota bacterium]
MRLSSLLSHVGYVRIRGSAEVLVTGIACDSRQVRPGDLFVCISGFHKDGHEFAGEAAEKGASVIVMEEGNRKAEKLEQKLAEKATVIMAASSRKMLAHLAAAFYGYPLRSMTSVAVTGTKGKTTTAYMVYEILKQSGKKTGIIGTNGAFTADREFPVSHTTPEAHELQRILWEMKKEGCTHVVMEVSSQGYKMERTAGLHFTCGIFTNLSPDHIGPGEHENFEDYLYQKSRLFQNCDMAVANLDDPWVKDVTGRAVCPVVTYGMDRGDYQALDLVFYKDSHMLGCEYRLRRNREGKKEETGVFLRLPGEYNVKNSMAAIAAAECLGIPAKQAAGALKELRVPGRMEVVSGSSRLWIIVDYAHNEISMENLLKTLKSYEPRNLICVFGCGGNRSRLRRSGMGRAAGTWADLSVITADNSRYEPLPEIIKGIEAGLRETKGKYLIIPDRREAISYAVRHGKVGDIIAIIGKGHEDYQETEGTRIHFSDREEVEKALMKYR